MFIVKSAVKKYCKDKKRRASKELIMYLDRKVNEIIDNFMSTNSKVTLKP